MSNDLMPHHHAQHNNRTGTKHWGEETFSADWRFGSDPFFNPWTNCWSVGGPLGPPPSAGDHPGVIHDSVFPAGRTHSERQDNLLGYFCSELTSGRHQCL